MTLTRLKDELRTIIAGDSPNGPILTKTIELIEELQLKNVELLGQIAEWEQATRLSHESFEQLKLEAMKISTERDTVIELFKQVLSEVISGTYPTSETKNNVQTILSNGPG